MSSIYGYYFWPSTGEGSLLNTIASVFLGGTSVFGGTGSVVGTFVASFIIGAINAGIVSAGINAFYTQLAFGLVIVISVVAADADRPAHPAAVADRAVSRAKKSAVGNSRRRYGRSTSRNWRATGLRIKSFWLVNSVIVHVYMHVCSCLCVK